jgi:hypothetical protein
VIAALALALVAATAAPEPTYFVERVVTMGGEVRRTSVFRNGMAVVVRERQGERKHLVRQRLTDIELQVIVQVTEEAYPDLARFSSPGQGPGLGTVELRLAPPEKQPLIVRFPAGTVLVLGAARLGQALDGLEARMSRFAGTREDLSAWQPKVGEWVELEDGRIVQVLEVLPNPPGQVVRLQIADGPASVFMSDDELRRRAVRRVHK